MSKFTNITLSPNLAHFITPNKATLLFALKGVIAISMALSIAMYLALDNPFWAAIPAVMLQGRPHSGFVIEKALFLIASSFVGAVLAFLILAYFIHTPMLAIAMLAIIIGIVTYFSSTVRHANFVFGLALIAITANMIVLFAISHIEIISSQIIFNIAFTRVSEVIVGASCAIFASAILFPLRMKDVLRTHTALLITHVQNYLLLVLDTEKGNEEKQKQLKVLLALIILINDDSSPNFYEHRQNAKRALYMVNQSLSLIALSKLLDDKDHLLVFKPLLDQFKISILDHHLATHQLKFGLVKEQLDQMENIPNRVVIQEIFTIYESILLAECENQQHHEFTPQHYSQRLKSHRDVMVGLLSSLRIVVVYLICIMIWFASAGSANLLMMIILPILFGQVFVQAPNPSTVLLKLGKGALLSIPIVILILFNIMSGITGYLEVFLLVLLPFLFLGLMAIANPTITPYGLGFCFSIITLVQPSNHMSFAADQSLVMGLGMTLSMLITAFSFQLIPKFPHIFLQKRIVTAMAIKINVLWKYKKYTHEQFNQDVAEKLLFLSSYQLNTNNSQRFFQIGILELLAGHILLNLRQELSYQKQSELFLSIKTNIYHTFLLLVQFKQDQIEQTLSQLELTVEKLVDDCQSKRQLQVLVQQLWRL